MTIRSPGTHCPNRNGPVPIVAFPELKAGAGALLAAGRRDVRPAARAARHQWMGIVGAEPEGRGIPALDGFAWAREDAVPARTALDVGRALQSEGHVLSREHGAVAE